MESILLIGGAFFVASTISRLKKQQATVNKEIKKDNRITFDEYQRYDFDTDLNRLDETWTPAAAKAEGVPFVGDPDTYGPEILHETDDPFIAVSKDLHLPRFEQPSHWELQA